MSASARLDELKKRYDENPRRFFAPLANEFRKAGDLDMAIGLCERHLAEQPSNMNGHVVYGQALFEAGRLDDARATFGTAISLDPENLIALRHLGDIARLNGDPGGARGWFRRILDADPRNEEILAFLAELDAAAMIENATPLVPQRAVVDVTPAFSSAKTVEIVPPVIPPPPVEESALALEVFGMEPTAVPPEAEPQPEPQPEPLVEVVEAPVTLLELPDFGDLPMLADDAGEAPVAESVAPIERESIFATPIEEYSAADTPVFGFESTSALVEDTPTFAAPPVIEEHSPFDTAPAVEAPLPEFEEEPLFAESSASPFVTATMAELYLQQGHADRALEVYQQLAAQRPDDEALKMRIRALMPTPIMPTRTQEFATTVAAPVAVPAAAPAAAAPVEQTAREFFAGFAALTVGPADYATPIIATPAVREPHPGSTIDALFGHVTPDAADEAAALALATYIQPFGES